WRLGRPGDDRHTQLLRHRALRCGTRPHGARRLGRREPPSRPRRGLHQPGHGWRPLTLNAAEARRRPLLGVALALAAATLRATFGLFATRLYTAGFTPLELASIRTWIGWLGLAMLAASRPGRLRITRRDLPFFALYGIGAFALFEVLFLIALERTGVAIAAAMLYT